MKLYHAQIWASVLDRPGKQVTTMAENPKEAKEKLEAEFGKGNVHDLHNKEDAERLR